MRLRSCHSKIVAGSTGLEVLHSTLVAGIRSPADTGLVEDSSLAAAAAAAHSPFVDLAGSIRPAMDNLVGVGLEVGCMVYCSAGTENRIVDWKLGPHKPAVARIRPHRWKSHRLAEARIQACSSSCGGWKAVMVVVAAQGMFGLWYLRFMNGNDQVEYCNLTPAQANESMEDVWEDNALS
jgi:hypothetical protein